MEFKGTKEKWRYEKPTSKYDACTVSESGKVIGYCAKDSLEDRSNEKLRSFAIEMAEMLDQAKTTISRLRRSISAHPDCVEDSEFSGYVDLADSTENSIEKLLKKAIE